MNEVTHDFSTLKALFINCSIKKNQSESHTQALIDKVANIMNTQGAKVEQIYARNHKIAFGMIKDSQDEDELDEWPNIQKKIMDADLLVIGTPIWLGVKSSIATQVIERMYAYSSDLNEKGQYAYYGKVAGCVITGNEDGVKHCAMDILFAMQHIGYVIPPQADCGWVGEAGPGPSYGDVSWDNRPLEGGIPAGFNNDFTNRNATFMAWNLMHVAKLLKDSGGIPAVGNTENDWREVTNAKSNIN